MGEAPEHRVREPLVVGDVVRVHGAALRPQRQEQALLLERQRRRRERRQELRGHVVGGRRHEVAALRIVQVRGRRVGAEQTGELATDPAQRLADIQRGADGGRDRGERFALAQALRQLHLQPRVVPGQPSPLEHHGDQGGEPGEIDGLEDVAGGAALDRLEGRFERRLTGDDDDLRGLVDPLGRAHDHGAVGVGQVEVEQDEGEGALAEQAEALLSRGGHDDRVPFALEKVAQEERDVGIVVDDQDRVPLAHPSEPITTRRGTGRSGSTPTPATRAARRRRPPGRAHDPIGRGSGTARGRQGLRSRRTERCGTQRRGPP